MAAFVHARPFCIKVYTSRWESQRLLRIRASTNSALADTTKKVPSRAIAGKSCRQHCDKNGGKGAPNIRRPIHPQAETDLIKRGMREAAQALGVEVRIHEVAAPEQVDDALAAMVRQGTEALVLTSGAATANRRHDVMRFAVERRLPTIVDVGWEAEHIRGLVAVTMAHLSVTASTATVVHAEQWQGWALGIADGVAQGVPAVV